MKHFVCLDGGQVSVNYDGHHVTMYVFGEGSSAVLTDGAAKELRDWLNEKYPVTLATQPAAAHGDESK